MAKSGKGKVLQTIINISGELSPTLGKTLDSVTDKLEGVNLKAVAAGAAISGIAVGTAVMVGKAVGSLAELGDAYNSALNDIAATTGLAGEELEGMGDVMKEVYGNNFGESMEDVAGAVSELHRQTGLMGDELQAVTEGAYALSDTFGYDVAESARAAKAMMTNFGISGEDAMSMIAAGAQNGLDYSGEFIDTINEYSVQFSKLGFSADEMFSVLQQGADSGAWNLDKVGDAIKEFSIRSIDGSTTTTHAFEALGLDAGDMMATFAAGGDEASVAFQGVLAALMDMDDEVQRDLVGVELFGTQWEDLGTEAMTALLDMESSAYDVNDALEGIKSVKYDNLTDAFQAVKRQAEVSLLPLATTIANAFTQMAPLIGNMFEQIGPIIEQATVTAMPFITMFLDGIAALIPEIMPMVMELAGAILPLLATFVSELLPPLLSLIQQLMPHIMSIVQALLPTLTSVLLTVLPLLMQLLNDVVMPLIAPLLQIVEAILPAVAPLIGSAVKSLEPLADLLGIVVGWIGKVVGWVAEGLSWVVDLVVGDSSGKIADAAGLKGYATGGVTNGLSIAGEDPNYPNEYIISLNPAYRSQNLSYWAEAGRMLGADSSDFSLGGGSGTYYDMGGVSFSPNITVHGNADRESIMEAIEAEYPEFLDMLERWFAERGQPAYA